MLRCARLEEKKEWGEVTDCIVLKRVLESVVRN